MKISAFHKAQGDTVEWYNGIDRYDKAYMAKVFTFTPDYGYYINADQVERGGTGYDIHKALPKGKGYGSLYRPERDIPLLRVSGL